jgi:hypothetical protein
MLGDNRSLTLTLFRTASDAKLSTLAIDIEPNPPTITPISGIFCKRSHRTPPRITREKIYGSRRVNIGFRELP